MDIDFSLEDTIETPLDLERVFTYPEGLRTARVLVRLMCYEYNDKHRSAPTLQPTITNSFHVSCSMSGLNPAMPNTLKHALTFRDLQSQSVGEVYHVADLSDAQSDSLESVEHSHVKLVPSSNADASLGDLYLSSRPPHTEPYNSTKHTYFQNNSYNTSSLHRFLPTHKNTSAAALDGQSGEQIEISRPPQGELQQGNSHSAIPSLNTIGQSTGDLTFSSNFTSQDRQLLDRQYLGFGTMAQPKKPTSHFPTTNSRHPTHRENGRPQTSHIAPQPYKIPRLCMQHSSTTSYPQLASKSSEDQEMLQVVEGLAPRISPISAYTGARPLISASGIEQMKKPAPRKRKIIVEGEQTKKPKLDKAMKTKRTPKPKPEKKELAKYQLDHAIWMRILEFCPVQFLGKARLISKSFKGMVDEFTSIYVNCRKENYGHDMPPPPLGLTERQYSNLLGSKGCLEPGCMDKNASRTHWSWAKRWCSSCWKSKIEREDRLIKNRGDRFSNRTTLTKLLECIPVGMHDSYMKPHDYADVDDNRPRGAPRLYKYYLREDVEKIFRVYDSLDPTPYEEDSTKTPEENAAAMARYQDLLAGLDEKRADFLAEKKAEIDEHMTLVQRIETGVRERRETNRTPYDKNRNARKELFTRRAREQLPHIDEHFVKSTTAFKAATRVFRDGGTERGWQTLKPKIEKEWEASKGKSREKASSNDLPQLDGAADLDMDDSIDFDAMHMDIDSAQARLLQSSIAQFGRTAKEAAMDHRNVGRMPSFTRALPSPESMALGSPMFPGVIPGALSAIYGQATSFSGPVTFPVPGWQSSTRNESSRGPMSITSLLSSNPSSSYPGFSS